ncbi:MAG: hypothetical protein ABJR46_02295 [Tateyamaria sp.]
MIHAFGTPGTNTGDCVHFNSHHDMVEVGAGWARDPFGAEVEGDRSLVASPAR